MSHGPVVSVVNRPIWSFPPEGMLATVIRAVAIGERCSDSVDGLVRLGAADREGSRRRARVLVETRVSSGLLVEREVVGFEVDREGVKVRVGGHHVVHLN